MRCIETRYRVDRKEIGFVKFILEAYEGLTVMSTVDPARGVVAFRTPPGSEAVLEMVLEDLAQRVLIEKLPRESWTPAEPAAV